MPARATLRPSARAAFNIHALTGSIKRRASWASLVLSAANPSQYVVADCPTIGTLASHAGGGGGPASIAWRVAAVSCFTLSASVEPMIANGSSTTTIIANVITAAANVRRPPSSLEEAVINGPSRETEYRGPEQCRHEWPQHEQATDQQDRQDNPAQVALDLLCKRDHWSTLGSQGGWNSISLSVAFFMAGSILVVSPAAPPLSQRGSRFGPKP